MDCPGYLSAMSEYLDGELAGPEAEAFERHRAGCARCRALLAVVDQMRRLYADERYFAMPEGAGARLRQALATGLDEPLAPAALRPPAVAPPPPPRRRAWLGFGADTGRLRAVAWVAAAAVVLLAVSVSRWQASASTTSGWLMDSHCYAAFKSHPGDHPSDCLLKCARQGWTLGLVDAKGDFEPFNAAGKAKAIAAVEASHEKNRLWVTVKTAPSRGPTLNVVALTLSQPATR